MNGVLRSWLFGWLTVLTVTSCQCDSVDLAPFTPSVGDGGGATVPDVDPFPSEDGGDEGDGGESPDAGSDAGVDAGDPDPGDACRDVEAFGDEVEWVVPVAQEHAGAVVSRLMHSKILNVYEGAVSVLLVTSGRPRIGAIESTLTVPHIHTILAHVRSDGQPEWVRTHASVLQWATAQHWEPVTGIVGIGLAGYLPPALDLELPWLGSPPGGVPWGGYSISYSAAGDLVGAPWLLSGVVEGSYLDEVVATLPRPDGRVLRGMNFGDDGHYRPMDASNDGVFLTLAPAGAGSLDFEYNLFVAMHGPDGEIEWSLEGRGGPIALSEIVPLEDGSFLLIGPQRGPATLGGELLVGVEAPGGAFLARITDDGRLVYAREVRGLTGTRHGAFRARGERGVCFADFFSRISVNAEDDWWGETLSLPASEGVLEVVAQGAGPQAAVGCLDDEGHALFVRTISNEIDLFGDGPVSDGRLGLGMDIAPDGTLVVVGSVNGRTVFDGGEGGPTIELSAQGGDGDTDGFVARYSPEGVLLDARLIPTPDHGWLESVAVHEGGYTAVGSYQGCIRLGAGTDTEVTLSQPERPFASVDAFIARFRSE